MDMNCATSADLVTRSLSGNASAQDEALLRSHLAACPACADLHRSLSATWALMGRMPELASQSPAPAVPGRLTLLRRPLWAVAGVAAAVLVIVALAFSLSKPAPSGSSPAPVAVNPPKIAPQVEPPKDPLPREVVAPAPNEKPQAPAPEAPAPVLPKTPETKTAVAPEAPAPKPAPEVRPETPERKDVVAKPESRPETRPEPKSAEPVPAPAPAALPVLATLERVDGDVFDLAGGARVAVKAGHKITANAALETAAKSGLAVLLFDDGTRVQLEADTLADSFQAAGGKRVTLKRGAINAQIAKQPAGEPMIFATATAEARVLGTRLTLSVTPTSTRLDVREGKVRMTRKDDGASVEVGAEHFVVAGKGLSMTPKPMAGLRFAMREAFDRPRWGAGWTQGGDANLGLRLAVENGSFTLKALQKPAQDLGGGKMPSDAAELARKALQGVNSVASLSRKDWPRSAWLETRQAFPFSNEAPLRIRTRAWNSHDDADRIVWIALNHGVAGQGLSLERRGNSLQLWVEGAAAPIWKKDAGPVQEWETIELWLSKDQVAVRRNDETLYAGANPLKVKAAALSLGVNAKMELTQDEEVRFDDVDVLLTTRSEMDEVAR
jgi:ferric-dicitrate binding protein FerR (iron transport regulator)